MATTATACRRAKGAQRHICKLRLRRIAEPCLSGQQDVCDCIWLRAHDLAFPGVGPTDETGLENSDEPTAVSPDPLMNEAHSPWPLFCNDLNQAQKWIIDKLVQTPTDRQLGHQALSLGLTGIVKKIITQDNLNLQDETVRQWKFRLARLNGSLNPYAELIPPDVQIYTDLQINHAKREGIPAVVSRSVHRRSTKPSACCLLEQMKRCR